jgi:lipopolysaccharide biosynthesis glycosyltransferase
MKDNIIHIAMAADDNFAMHLAVAIASMLKNLSGQYRLCAHILVNRFSSINRERIEALKSIRDFDLDFRQVDLDGIQDLSNPLSPYITNIASARILLPQYLYDVECCIYLDSDIVVCEDLGQLWLIDIEENYLGAMEDPICQSRRKMLGIPENFSYFNAGVLIFNLAKMRAAETGKRVRDFVQANYLRLGLGEQDALNALFYEQCLILPLKWNMMTSVYICDIEFQRYDFMEIQQAWRDPAICHYTYEKKPDSMLSLHPYSREYQKYLKLTAWKDERLKDVSFKAFSVQMRHKILSRLLYLKRSLKKNCLPLYQLAKKLRNMVRF